MNTDILKSAIAAIKAELEKLELELEAALHPVAADSPPAGGGGGDPPPPPPEEH